MKYALQAICLVLSGAAIATIVLTLYGPAAHSRSASVTTKEIRLTFDDDSPAATLSATNEGAMLHFFDRQTGKEALRMGVYNSDRYITFFAPDSTPVAALNVIGDDGAATLFLGDRFVNSRIELGAMLEQRSPDGSLDGWSLTFIDPTNTHNVLFRAMVRPDPETGRPIGSSSLNRSGITKLRGE